MNGLFAHFDMQDTSALAFFILCWVGYNYFAAHHHKNLLKTTNHYRLQWMRSMLKRENRSVDAIIIGNLMRSITFSTNTTIFILAGLIGMLSYHEQVGVIINAIPFAKPMTQVLWELKVCLLIIIFIYAYFKYTWSLRQQNYTSILVGSAPIHSELPPDADNVAKKCAFLAGNAAEHFNNGLRAYYFGLAVLGWFIHPFLFIGTTAIVVAVIYRREYRSHTLHYLGDHA